MKLVVVASASFDDEDLFAKTMTDFVAQNGKPEGVAVAGLSRIDTFVKDWASKNTVPLETLERDYNFSFQLEYGTNFLVFHKDDAPRTKRLIKLLTEANKTHQVVNF